MSMKKDRGLSYKNGKKLSFGIDNQSKQKWAPNNIKTITGHLLSDNAIIIPFLLLK